MIIIVLGVIFPALSSFSGFWWLTVGSALISQTPYSEGSGRIALIYASHTGMGCA